MGLDIELSTQVFFRETTRSLSHHERDVRASSPEDIIYVRVHIYGSLDFRLITHFSFARASK